MVQETKQESFTAEQKAQQLEEEVQCLKQENKLLREANRLKNLCISQASHELKTPITSIRCQTQLILRRLAQSQQVVPDQLSLPTYLEKIEEQTHRLQALIENLLDGNYYNSDKTPLQITQCNFGNLCCEILEDQRAFSDREIELDLPVAPLVLSGDSRRLAQVIINLVGNALKYSLENTVIRVCASQEPGYLILTVHNDGPAIQEAQQKYIFEPFYRTLEAECSGIQGLGLGLSISKEIVERHAGQIWVESSEEKGTTFFVRLPLQGGGDS
jgi:signal transduction histidine kinase